jgi:hypothetical protein
VELDPEPAGVEVDDDAVDQEVQELALLLGDERAPERAEAIEQPRDMLDLALRSGECPQPILDLAELDAEVIDLRLDLAQPLRERLAAAATDVAERAEETLRFGVEILCDGSEVSR